MSNTLVKDIKKYCKEKYDLDFKEKSEGWITYTKGKMNYSFYCQYVWFQEEQLHWWCICCDVMDKNEWYGYDTHYKDNGKTTIDEILRNEFHLINNEIEEQLKLF